MTTDPPPPNTTTTVSAGTTVDRPVTIADVAMKLANDGPIYAIIGLVSVLAFKGQASAMEMVVTGLATLLARSWPRAVKIGGGAAIMLFFLTRAFITNEKGVIQWPSVSSEHMEKSSVSALPKKSPSRQDSFMSQVQFTSE